MISNKTSAILLLITLNAELVTSTSSDTQEPSSSSKLVPRLKGRERVSGTKSVLVDMTSIVKAVGATEENTDEMDTPEGQEISRVNEFAELVGRGEYGKIVEFGKDMNQKGFMKQLSSVVKTPEQYKGLSEHLEYGWKAYFSVYGDFGVVKKAIITYSGVNDFEGYTKGDILLGVLKLALEKDEHDRAVELLNFREEIASGKTKWPKNRSASFARFLSLFFEQLTTEIYEMMLKRFLTLHGDKFKNKYPDIFDTFYRALVAQLRQKLGDPDGEKLLADLIGQPSMLTPTLLARGYLESARDGYRYVFVEYAWREAIEEGLKKECPGGGERLWQAMTENYKDRFSGDYPSTPNALANVLKWFSTKQQKEDEWTNAVAPGFLDLIKLIFADIFPADLTSLVIGYGRPTWIDILCIKSE